MSNRYPGLARTFRKSVSALASKGWKGVGDGCGVWVGGGGGVQVGGMADGLGAGVGTATEGGGWVPQAVSSRKTISKTPGHLFIAPSSARNNPVFIIYGRARGELGSRQNVPLNGALHLILMRCTWS